MSQRVWGARLPLTLGFGAVVLLLGGIGVWSVQTEIAGAVVASGKVQVESRSQVIQHPEGGVVGEILAHDGDTVAAGDILVKLDGTFLSSELAIIEQQLVEIFARRTRLVAERDDADDFTYQDRPEFMIIETATVEDQLAGQKNLFEARKRSLVRELEQLTEQQSQIERQIEGAESQQVSFEKQLTLIEQELADVQSLFDKGLVETTRLLALQRQQASLEGEIGRLTSSIAESAARISGLAIEALRLADARREAAITQLRDIQYSEIELKERRLSLIERLSRLDIRAPVNGIVFDSRVLAPQAVISAAEPITFIVPGDQPLQVSARIDPNDIEQVYSGQDVRLMFTTFSRRTTPEVLGKVVRVAADAQTDEVTGLSYYEAILRPDAEALAKLENVELLPGMPVEAFLKTEDRTPLSYLTQPLTVYFQRAFRGD
ncbi:HlyD family type I secretion periplasmic adaptor subunit [uncultured Boseongicola sp.]|uniref:HlyD family type I secretion periplasmic adaptor subunit n=1 Tax=uncultured Boseongicola sp. TaxID=1648499 RepID=UPI002635BD7E|nr:HlyD family type I secretion periplasmic adaptor subunit [uncultured Boseongicola sp.]